MYKKRIKCYHLVIGQIQKMMTFIVALSAPLVHQVTIILFRAHSFTYFGSRYWPRHINRILLVSKCLNLLGNP